jgi:putative transposase
MRQVRYIVPGQTVLITRRILRRAFRLRPSELTNQIVGYLLAALLPAYDIDCFGYVVMSNHVHLGLVDNKGRLPSFLRQFFSLLARALNRLHGTSDIVWDGRGPDIVYLADLGAVVDKVGYIMANPVKAGLVEYGREWPGLRSQSKHYGKSIIFSRPPVFFYGLSKRLPAEGTLTLAIPPMAAHLDRGAFVHQVEQAVHVHEQAARAAHRKTGRPFLGAPACRATDPFACPTTPPPKSDTRHSEVAARDSVSRDILEKCLHDFRQAYAETRATYLDGHRDVRWPYGTWYRVHIDRCAVLDPCAPRIPTST